MGWGPGVKAKGLRGRGVPAFMSPYEVSVLIVQLTHLGEEAR